MVGPVRNRFFRWRTWRSRKRKRSRSAVGLRHVASGRYLSGFRFHLFVELPPFILRLHVFLGMQQEVFRRGSLLRSFGEMDGVANHGLGIVATLHQQQ